MSNTTISSAFSIIKEPRKKGIKHPLINIITMTLCAVISGCNDFESIAEYSKTKQVFFSQFLDVSTGIPSADTFLDVINKLNPTQFEKAFTDSFVSI